MHAFAFFFKLLIQEVGVVKNINMFKMLVSNNSENKRLDKNHILGNVF